MVLTNRLLHGLMWRTHGNSARGHGRRIRLLMLLQLLLLLGLLLKLRLLWLLLHRWTHRGRRRLRMIYHQRSWEIMGVHQRRNLLRLLIAIALAFGRGCRAGDAVGSGIGEGCGFPRRSHGRWLRTEEGPAILQKKIAEDRSCFYLNRRPED